MAPRSSRALLVLVAAASLVGCHLERAPMHPQSPAGDWHVVAPGETLADIARVAGVPAEDILELNGLKRADEVKPGRLIFVLAPPGAAVAAEPAPPESSSSPERFSPSDASVAGARLRWPLVNVARTVGSPFGARGARAHEGIDLPAPMGTPVVAAADGQVVYAGNAIRGYGNLVVLQHAGDLLTVYAHNAELFVTPGQTVRAGERIAAVGQTGHATGPHLHFEVRQGQIPRDPMPYLTNQPNASATP